MFVDKIPDLRMERVIDERRTFYQNNLGNEFSDYYLAHRARSLHQKLGRLIRRDSDIGGAIVVDRRIKKWKGGTIQKFLKLMAPYRVERCKLKEACEQVKAFL